MTMLDERGLLRSPSTDGVGAIIAVFKMMNQKSPREEMSKEEYLQGEWRMRLLAELACVTSDIFRRRCSADNASNHR